MRVYFLSFLIVLSAYPALAQEVRLNVYGNYVFDDKVESYYNSQNYFHGTIQGGFLWGLGAEFRMHDSYGLELLYLHQTTTAPTTYYDNSSLFGEVQTNLDLNINWIMGGFIRSSPINPKVEPFGGLLLGAAIIDGHNSETGSSGNATKFAWGLDAGCNVWLSKKVGLKFQATLLSAVQAAGGTIYFGTGGAGTGVTGYSSMFQFALGGGLVFKFAK